MINRGSTLTLKAVLLLIGLGVLFLLLWFPQIEGRNANSDPISLYFNDPFLAYIYLTFSPFFIALYQAIKLLHLIEKNKFFSEGAVKALRNIKYCVIAFIGFLTLLMPWVFMFAQQDDAPGLVVIAIVIILASGVIATGVAVAQKLLQSAVDLKSENDLTV